MRPTCATVTRSGSLRITRASNLFQSRFHNQHILLHSPPTHPNPRNHHTLALKRHSTTHNAVFTSRNRRKRKKRLPRLHHRNKVNSPHPNKRRRISFPLSNPHRKSRRPVHPVHKHHIPVNVDDTNRNRHLNFRSLNLHANRTFLSEPQQIHKRSPSSNVALQAAEKTQSPSSRAQRRIPLAFLLVGATACFARPCNARENVAYLPRRNAIRHSPRSIHLINAISPTAPVSPHKIPIDSPHLPAYEIPRQTTPSSSPA